MRDAAEVRVEVRGDYAAGGWFLDYVGGEVLPFTIFYTGPFASRSDATAAIPEYKKVIARALGT